MKTNIFNFISKINELEDQLQKTTSELAKVKKVNAISNALTGIEIVKQEKDAREKIINELYPKALWEKEITHIINREIVDEWLKFLEGQFDSETVIEVRNDRLRFIGREKDKIIFRYYDSLNTISIHIL